MTRALLAALLLTLSAARADEAARADALGDPLPAGAKARLGTTRLRHFGSAQAVACSPDGSTVAVISHTRALCLAVDFAVRSKTSIR
jgi:hypothetical protein